MFLRVEIISKEKKSRDYTVGFQEEVETDRKVGFLVNHVKMIKKEQNPVEEKMPLKELNKDVGQLVRQQNLQKKKGSIMWKNILKADPKTGTGKKPKGFGKEDYTQMKTQKILFL